MKKNKASLLLDLDEYHYDALHEELIGISKNVVFHYVIDNHEVVRYVLPFETNQYSDEDNEEEVLVNNQESIDYLTDEQYVLENLFLKDDNKLVLLDEYFSELVRFKKYLLNSNSVAQDTNDLLERYQDEFVENGILASKDEKDLKQIIEKKLTLVLAYSLGILNDGMSKLINIFKQKRFIIENSDFTNIADVDEIRNAFSINKEKTKLFRIIKELLEQRLQRTFSVEDMDDYSNFLRKESKRSAIERDALAITRILEVNSYLAKEYIKGKTRFRHIFLYVSPTSSSNEIFYEQSHLRNWFPIIDDKIVNPLRNNGQLFLKNLIFTDKANIKTAVETLAEFKKRILEIKKYKEKILQKVVKLEIDGLLVEYFKYSRVNLEVYHILSQYFKFEGDIIAAKEDLRKRFFPGAALLHKKLIELLDVLIEMGQNKREVAQGLQTSLENVDIMLEFETSLNLAILSFKNETIVRFNSGNDYIRGAAHHLPIIFLNRDVEFQNIVRWVSDNIVHKRIVSGNEFLKFIESTIRDYLLGHEKSYEEKLLRAFIFLLLPDIEDKNNSFTAFSWANYILNNEIVSHANRNEVDLYERDYRYLVIWASRRCERYENALYIANESIKLFSDDPRFYHGRSLIYYCFYEKGLKINNTDLTLLDRGILDAIKALGLYEFLKNDNNYLIQSTQNALRNSIAYFYAEMFNRSGKDVDDGELLPKARSFINEIKYLEGESYEKYAEYLHTESFLEFQEYKVYNFEYISEERFEFKKVLKLRMEEKIDYAMTAIEKAISIIRNRGTLSSLEMYSQMRKEIIDEKNKIVYLPK